MRPKRGRIELQALVPRLPDNERQELRAAGLGLRNESAGAAPTAAKAPEVKAWALVTRPSSNKRQSELAAAQLQAVALLQPLPMRAELLKGSDGWRAVFWPFSNAKDAEKVRLALADKGLSTDLLEF